ncbi:Acetylornithine deacetylase [Glycine soja]
MAANLLATLGDLERDSFVPLLSKLIGESKHPPELIPQEDRVVKHVLDILLPFSTTSSGGPLLVNHVTYHAGRGNLIIEYPGTVPGKILSFVGCHMDVVTVNPNDWDFDPLSLTVDGDKLRGRGTTDCLGHVALATELVRKLGETKSNLKSTIVAVFIANEENSAITGVGVDALVKDGLLNKLKDGPLNLSSNCNVSASFKFVQFLLRYWIDTADKQPGVGTGGHKCARASHGCSKGNSVVILSRLPTSSSGTGLWVCNPFNHETNPMELSRRWNQSNSRGMYYFRRCQINSILQEEFQGSVKVRAVKLESLRRDVELLKMEESETVKDYYSKVKEIVNQMRAFGEDILDKKIVEKILITMLQKFDPIVTTIDETKDMSILSDTELVGSLEAYEQRLYRHKEHLKMPSSQSLNFSPKTKKMEERKIMEKLPE